MNILQHVHIATTAANLYKYAQRLWFVDPENTINYESERNFCIKCMKEDIVELRKALNALQAGGDKKD